MLGVPEMCFPRLNNIALIILLPALQCLLGSVITDEGSGTG
jgi:heme/copper-type cytochrome/quinol oxidase subunit 1